MYIALIGVFPWAARNAMTYEERNTYLPVMKSLVKVMESRYPAPEDVNTLLVLSRDLGAKYLGFFSSRSLNMREKYISFAQFVYFLRKVCLLFNF